MKRDQFNSAIIAAATALVLPIGLATKAEALSVDKPLALGETKRFPGYILKAYREENEIYLAYSKEAILRYTESAFDSKEVIAARLKEIQEMDPNEIVSNSEYVYYDGICDGNCSKEQVTLEGDDEVHECFIVANVINDWVKLIDDEKTGNYINQYNEKYGNTRSGKWHPETIGLVDQLWTSYN